MIEVVSDTRCVHCDRCVVVCPTNVFDAVPDAAPVIARQAECQTCFLCEAYCPVDALFVAAESAGPLPVDSPLRDEEVLVASGLLGSYRRNLGWGRGRTTTAPLAGLLYSTSGYREVQEAVPKKAIPGRRGEIAPV